MKNTEWREAKPNEKHIWRHYPSVVQMKPRTTSMELKWHGDSMTLQKPYTFQMRPERALYAFWFISFECAQVERYLISFFCVCLHTCFGLSILGQKPCAHKNYLIRWICRMHANKNQVAYKQKHDGHSTVSVSKCQRLVVLLSRDFDENVTCQRL